MRIKQTRALTYRHIDGDYYVTNIRNREVVVLNELAFRILEVADACDVDDVCRFFTEQSETAAIVKHQHKAISREEVVHFLEELKTLSLIDF